MWTNTVLFVGVKATLCRSAGWQVRLGTVQSCFVRWNQCRDLCWDGKHQGETPSIFFFDGKQCSALCWGRKLLYAVVPLRKPGLDELKRLKIGSKWGLYEVKMSCLRACEGAFETNNPAWCRQEVPRPFATVPIKQFGVFLNLILEDFWASHGIERWSLF